MTTPLLAVTLPGGSELLIILVIVLLLFGGRRLPELARSLRRARDEFTEGSKEGDEPSDPEGRAGSA